MEPEAPRASGPVSVTRQTTIQSAPPCGTPSSRRRIVVTSAERGDQGDTTMSTHPTHGTTRTRAWSVADNLARIEFTPDDLERLELF